VSKLENICGFNQATPAIKGSASRTSPENNRVGSLSATPCQRFVQQPFSKSLASYFRDNIKVRHVSMKLRLVLNWIRHFLKQLHTNMTEQLFAVVENPAAPWARADPKPLFHP